MTIVLDSGVVLATVLWDEPFHSIAKALMGSLEESGEAVAAPVLLRYEITSVMRLSVVKKRLSLDEARDAMHYLLEYPITYFDSNQLHDRAFGLATDYNLPRAYDTQYVSLAHELECDMWTIDERLFNSVGVDTPRVRWLGDFS